MAVNNNAVKSGRSTVLYTNATTATITAQTLVEISAGYVGVAVADIPASATGELAFGCEVTVTKSSAPAIAMGEAAKILSGVVYPASNTSATTLVNARPHTAAITGATTITLGIW